MFILYLFYLFITYSIETSCAIDPKKSLIWGPGLKPHFITMPARYFFIQAIDEQNQNVTTDPGDAFNITIAGVSTSGKPCRIWSNNLNRKDGSFIIRYKLYEQCKEITIKVQHANVDVAQSPYKLTEQSLPDDCPCPKKIDSFLSKWECGSLPHQINSDLEAFKTVNWDLIRDKVISKFDQPHSISLCHFIIKNNEVYRKCYGKYVGFKMFIDSLLLSLTRKLVLPDLEFFVNLGDWPLVKINSEQFPIFSWCGSKDFSDIIMPTYDLTESTLENMGRVMLDILSVQGNVKHEWDDRQNQAFWRGRDSSQHRLDLIDISRAHPDLFNVSLTNFFFFRDQQEKYGPKAEHISFFDFFNYKYQLAIDGTVAAYRFPYLLAGGSLIIKQDSQYYEHFYNELKPYVHFIPMKRNLSNLVDKINWALTNGQKAKEIAKNGQKYANDNLLPQNIFCYYVQLLNEFGQRIISEVKVLDGMEKVDQIKQATSCDCNEISSSIRNEL